MDFKWFLEQYSLLIIILLSHFSSCSSIYNTLIFLLSFIYNGIHIKFPFFSHFSFTYSFIVSTHINFAFFSHFVLYLIFFLIFYSHLSSLFSYRLHLFSLIFTQFIIIIHGSREVHALIYLGLRLRPSSDFCILFDGLGQSCDSPVLCCLVVFGQQWQQYCTYWAEILWAGGHSGIKQICLFAFARNDVVVVLF